MHPGKQAAIWIVMATLLATLALADQPQPSTAGVSGGFDLLIDNPSVQKELKLSEEQAEHIRDLRRQIKDKALTKIREQSSTPRKDGNAADPQARAKEIMKAASDETLKGLADILKPEQLKRLRQIRLQQEGLNALFDPEVIKILKLTDEQRSKIQAVQDNLKKESVTLLKAGPQSNFQESLRKIMTLRRESLDKGLALLTSDQMKAWIELAGEPFEMKAAPFILQRPQIGK